LLFGPDVVVALRAHTDALLDVHLSVTDLELWIGRFVAAGADMVTVPVAGCRDPAATVEAIHELGARAGLALHVEDPLDAVLPYLDVADRVLVMGTRLGIKGVDLDPQTPGRVRALAQGRAEIVVDGGIRRHTVPLLAEAGADGIVPGSLVFAEPDPRAAVAWIQQGRT
jgi:ribulose-phosphate 3-epimerase